MKKLILICLALLVVATGNLFADTIYLVDGTSHNGRLLVTDSGYDLHLADGSITRLLGKDVASIEFETSTLENYHQRATAIKYSQSAESHYKLGLWASENTLIKEANLQFERTVSIDPQHAAAQTKLGRILYKGSWIARADILRAKGFVQYKGRWMLKETYQELMKDLSTRNSDSMFLNNKELTLSDIKATLETMGKDKQQIFLIKGLTHNNMDLRIFCAEELVNFSNEAVVSALFDVSLLDQWRDVRMTAVKSLSEISKHNGLDIEKDYIKQMGDERVHVRIAATDALAHVGGPIGIKTMVRNYRITFAGGARGHYATTTQISYIEDYDVQIATASQIADPVIGILQVGTVIDAQSLRITEYITIVEREVLWKALEKVTGRPVEKAADEEDVDAWWGRNKHLYGG